MKLWKLLAADKPPEGWELKDVLWVQMRLGVVQWIIGLLILATGAAVYALWNS